jgi:hypothetical protein
LFNYTIQKLFKFIILNVDTNSFSKLTIKQIQEIYINLIIKYLKTKSTKSILQLRTSFNFVKLILQNYLLTQKK